jgi:maltooligosyltrehalose trehalohydrolase
MPRLAGARFGEAHAADDGLLKASWRLGDGAALHLAANLSPREIANTLTQMTGTPIWGGAPGGRLPPWSVFWRIGA